MPCRRRGAPAATLLILGILLAGLVAGCGRTPAVPAEADLRQLVQGLLLLDRAPGAEGLTDQQRPALVRALRPLANRVEISDRDARTAARAVRRVLTPAQQKTLEELAAAAAAGPGWLRGGGSGFGRNPEAPPPEGGRAPGEGWAQGQGRRGWGSLEDLPPELRSRLEEFRAQRGDFGPGAPRGLGGLQDQPLGLLIGRLVELLED